MKYWFHVIIILIIGFGTHFVAPWWSLAITAILSAFILKINPWTALLFGFLAGFILWALVAFYIDVENQGILSSRVGELFGGLGSIALIAITGLIGGLLASLGSYIGASIRSLSSLLMNKGQV